MYIRNYECIYSLLFFLLLIFFFRSWWIIYRLLTISNDLIVPVVILSRAIYHRHWFVRRTLWLIFVIFFPHTPHFTISCLFHFQLFFFRSFHSIFDERILIYLLLLLFNHLKRELKYRYECLTVCDYLFLLIFGLMIDLVSDKLRGASMKRWKSSTTNMIDFYLNLISKQINVRKQKH